MVIEENQQMDDLYYGTHVNGCGRVTIYDL
jgi:hypothetical protein